MYKRIVKLILLGLLAFAAPVMGAQTAAPGLDAAIGWLADPALLPMLNFLENRLPQLADEDRTQAVREYQQIKSGLQNLTRAQSAYLDGYLHTNLEDVDQAIASFEAASDDPQLAPGARQMLNLLLYYKAGALLNSGDLLSAQDFLRSTLKSYRLGKYYPTFLYLLIDILAETDKHNEALSYIESYRQDLAWLEESFRPRKQALVGEVEALDLKSLYDRPDTLKTKSLVRQIESIQSRLGSLYSEVRVKSLCFDPVQLDSLYGYESSKLSELNKQINSYAISPEDLKQKAGQESVTEEYTVEEKETFTIYKELDSVLREAQRTVIRLKQKIKSVEELLQKRYEKYLSGDPSVLGTGHGDLELKRLIEIEKNIETYQEIIITIDQLQAKSAPQKLDQELRQLRAEYFSKLADLKIRKERHLAYLQQQQKPEFNLFLSYLKDYYTLNELIAQFDQEVPETEEEIEVVILKRYNLVKQGIIADKSAEMVRQFIQDPVFSEGIRTFNSNLDFLTLQHEYRYLNFREQERKANQDQLSPAEDESRYTQVLTAKAELLTQYQQFVQDQPTFHALEQPDGSFLVNLATVYYSMAELQNALTPDKPELSLPYYRKVLEVEPEFPQKDYVLYNIGFLLSEYDNLTRDQKVVQFIPGQTVSQTNDRVSSGTRERLQEAVDAFIEVSRNPRSRLYDESLYRLGSLYFRLGISSEEEDEPIKYYDQARQYFNQLISKPESRYHYEAIFQRGWLDMNQADDRSLTEAVNDFMTLLRATDNNEIMDADLAEDYRENAVTNIGYCLAAMDSLDFTREAAGLAMFDAVFADYPDLTVKTRILDNAASGKAEIGAPLQAVRFLERRLMLDPLYLGNPVIADSIVKLLHAPALVPNKEELQRLTADRYRSVIQDYDQGSRWYQANIRSDNLETPQVRRQLEVVRRAYEYTSIDLYNQMIASKAGSDLKRYLDHLDRFKVQRDLFGDEYAADVAKLDDLGIFAQASIVDTTDTAMMHQVVRNLWSHNDKYPENKNYFFYEERAYNLSEIIYRRLKDGLDTGGDVSEELFGHRDSLFVFYRDASLRFRNVLNLPRYANDETRYRSVLITVDIAGIQVAQGLLQEARNTYDGLLRFENNLDPETRMDIYVKLAEIAEKENKLSEAEQAYRNALQNASDKKNRESIAQLIRMQIQKSINAAEANADYDLAAREYLRLSDEYGKSKEAIKNYIGQRTKATEAYIKGGKYLEAIEVKKGLLSTATNISEKYAYYYDCWGIADTLIQDQALVRQLKEEFIALAPTSNYAYRLKYAEIDDYAQDPARRSYAADLMMQLHDLVKAKKIDSGGQSQEDLYINSMKLYRDSGDTDKVITLMESFTKIYPKDLNTPVFLDSLALHFAASGDAEKHEYYARELFLKDKTQFLPYQAVAMSKLDAIIKEIREFYRQGDWSKMFQKIDQFKKVEALYKRDKLALDTAKHYKWFDSLKAEYDELQAKKTYLESFERQMRASEQSELLRKSAAELIFINHKSNRRWHLYDGEKRIPKLERMADAEVQKITYLLEQPRSKYLSNAQILKAGDLLARLHERAAAVIETQYNRYLQIADEVGDLKRQFGPDSAELMDKLDAEVAPYIEKYRTRAKMNYSEIYNTFVLSGYSDPVSKQIESKVQSGKLLPEFKIVDYPLDKGWEFSLSNPERNTDIYDWRLKTITSSMGSTLGSCVIPPRDTLTVTRQLTLPLVPEKLYLFIASELTPKLLINGRIQDIRFIAIDSLAVGDSYLPRYSSILNQSYLKLGDNELSIVSSNDSNLPVTLNASFRVVYEQDKYDSTQPAETVRYWSDGSWIAYRIDPDTGKSTNVQTVETQTGTMLVDRSEQLTDPQVQPIWIAESDSSATQSVAFEFNFDLTTQLREGYLDLIAPDIASVYLNGSPLITDYEYEYDIDAERKVVLAYPRRVYITKDSVLKGNNKLRVEITSTSQFRFMLAELVITKAVQEL